MSASPNRLLAILIGTGALVLSGCSTQGYRCKIPNACSPVHTTYQEALHDTSRSGWEVKPLAGRGPLAGRKPLQRRGVAPPHARAPTSGGDTGRPEDLATDQTSGAVAPIYVPPRPWRAWLAPWSDGAGRLVSGSYVWFTTPGRWRYLGRNWPATPLSAQQHAAAQGLFAPVPPSALGFTPGKAAAPEGVLPSITQPFPVRQGTR